MPQAIPIRGWAVPFRGSASFGSTPAFLAFFWLVAFRPLICSAAVRDIANRLADVCEGLISHGFSAVVDRVSDSVELAAYRRLGCRLARVGKITFKRFDDIAEIGR